VDVLILPGAAGPEVFALFFAVAEREVVFVAVVFVAVVFVAVVFAPDVAEPQASVDTAVAFHVSVPVSVFAVEVDSPGFPRLPAFPNADYHASSSNSVEVVG
jgi:hypothetical protein